MDWRHYVRSRLPALAIPAERETAIVDELALQLEAIYERAISEGATADQARLKAEAEVPDWVALARTLGTIERPAAPAFTPGCESGGAMNGLAGDARYALRNLLRTPAFTAVSLMTLALGLGVAAAAFTVVDRILIQPLAFPASDRLVMLHASVPPEGSDTVEVTYLDMNDVARETDVFKSVALVMPYAGTATALDPPERIEGLDVSITAFDTFGVQPALGRAFTENEGQPGQDNVVILGHGFWQRLGGRPDVIGQTLVLDDVPKTIVGVMPANFRVEVLNQPDNVYRPVTRDHFAAGTRAFRAFRGIARLQDGATIEQAGSVVATVGDRLAREFPDTNAGRSFTVRPLQEDVVGGVRRPLLMIAGLVALVLTIAAVNLLNLLLARAVARARDIAVRVALGASVWRLARGSIVEGALLAGAGALLGIVVAQAIVAALAATPGVALPRLREIVVDRRVMLTIALAAAAAAVSLGLVPLFLQRHLRGSEGLRTGHETAGMMATRMRNALVVGQTALAFILIAATVLLAVSLKRVLALPLGFDAGVATMRVSVPAARYRDRDATVRFFSGLADDIAQRPGVQQAGFVSVLPLSGNTGSSITIQGREDIPVAARPGVGWQWANPTYFAAMGMPIVQGRGFSSADLRNPSHVTVINETLARLHFPGEDPIGQRVYFGPVPASGVPEWHQIIGVVGDVRHRRLEGEPDARAYDLFGQHWGRTISLAIRSGESTSQAAAMVRSLLADRDPRLAVFAIRSTDALVSNAVTSRRLLLWLVAVFAAIGLAVALLGVYGIVACMVEERRRELGVRVALGATAINIHRLVVMHGLRLVAAGLVLGVAGALALRRGIEAQLFSVSATNMPALLAVAAALLCAAALPCFVVSRRATRIDPVTALRTE
jgi:predicted permease